MIRFTRSARNSLLGLAATGALLMALVGASDREAPPAARIPSQGSAGLTSKAVGEDGGSFKKLPRKDLLVGDRELAVKPVLIDKLQLEGLSH